MSDLAVFISYSHKDSDYLQELRPHLQILEDEFGVPFWDDSRMPPGVLWQDMLNRMIDSSAIIICFLSENYFASSFIKNTELDLIRKANLHGAPLFPLYVRPFSLRADHWLTKLQGVNTPDKTLLDMNEAVRANLYSDTAAHLRVALKEKLETLRQTSISYETEKRTMPESVSVKETHSEKSARYNIAVVGRTGVGKSELINYLFGKEVAEAGVGKPITKRGFTRQDFELNGIPGTLFDSWGLEHGKSEQWLKDLNEEMRKRGTDRPAEDWFHTIFFCIDACSYRVQDFEISIIKQFLDEKYRAVVIFTKSDLASNKKINALKDIIEKEISENITCILVCSTSEELATGHTIPFGANDVIMQIYAGFWQSIIQRLPSRCVVLICQEVDKWQVTIADYIDKETGIFNQREIIDHVESEYQKFLQNMEQKLIGAIIVSEINRTVALFKKFEDLLDYSLVERHNIEIKAQFEIISAVRNDPFAPRPLLSGALGAIASQVASTVSTGFLASVLVSVPVMAAIVGIGLYFGGETIKSRFKSKIKIAINDLTDELKLHLRASESQIAMNIKAMLRIDPPAT